MIAGRSRDEPPAALGLQVVFAHEAADLLGIDGNPAMAQLGTNPAIAIGLKLIADLHHDRDDCSVASRQGGNVVVGRARQAHQAASFGDREATGPVMTDVFALLGRGALFRAPFKNSISRALPPHHALQSGDFRFVLLQETCGDDVVLEGAGLATDKVAGEIVALRQRMEGLARNVFLGDLTLELSAVGAVLGQIGVRLPPDLRAKVEAAAAKEALSVSSWLRRAALRALRTAGPRRSGSSPR